MAGKPSGISSNIISETLFQGPDDGELDTATEIPEEQALWLAVIGRAWLDTFEVSDICLSKSEPTRKPEAVRAEARRWLTFNIDPWREDRETVCDFAGIDPDMIRNAARRRIAETKKAKAMELDTAFLELVSVSETMDAAALDSALAKLANLEATAA